MGSTICDRGLRHPAREGARGRRWSQPLAARPAGTGLEHPEISVRRPRLGGEERGRSTRCVLRGSLRRNPAATLSVVGGHPPIEADRVVGHGPLSLIFAEERRRLEALFEASTCFVMPSFHEPAGIVYVEAAASGLPSIGTTAGGAPELVGEGLIVDFRQTAARWSKRCSLSGPRPEIARESEQLRCEGPRTSRGRR